jgi:hypothetical protein
MPHKVHEFVLFASGEHIHQIFRICKGKSGIQKSSLSANCQQLISAREALASHGPHQISAVNMD